MIAVLKPGTTETQQAQLIKWLEGQNVEVHVCKGQDYTILGLIGNTSKIDMDLLESMEAVESVKPVSEPFKQCNRKFHPDDTIIDVKGVKIGGGNFAVIAGPCSVESHDQLLGIARDVKRADRKSVV